ncbi:MAG TPA: hypothetical protein VL147_05385 [Devosia sp.]|nr:hypothetical protein [Devosia sp.]
MYQGKHGLQVFDEMGRPLLEVGPHVVSDSSEFAQKIGVIAASWSQAEVNLNCLFAVLLDTTPEEAAKELKKHGTAAKATLEARKIAANTLKGAELDSLSETLDQLDRARQQRNRVQHDVWARKAGDSRRVFAIHSNEYLALTTKLVAVRESTDGKDASVAIEVAMAFASEVTNGYAIEDLEEIATAIDSVSKSLLHAMFHRIRLRLAEEWKGRFL